MTKRRLHKSKYQPGQDVHAKSHRTNGNYVLLKLIKYVPNYEWYGEYYDVTTGSDKKDYFDERDFD